MAGIAVFIAIEFHNVQGLLHRTTRHGEAEEFAHLLLIEALTGGGYGAVGVGQGKGNEGFQVSGFKYQRFKFQGSKGSKLDN